MMQLFISTLLITIGSFFILLAGVGLVRMPDLFLRVSASTKAATLGVGATLLGVALYFGDFATFIRAGAIIVFLLLTAPVAAHLIGRAAYQDGVPLWEKTEFDDLR
ncbi:MAG: monovalent cation/H(+) antiporter subunit G [Candidatus Electrothrix sp. Rat3]|nr:monovalent cation/H(+) antiporter subunit G [Candidatus Electrothrix rattekaaiensis]